MRLQIQSDSNRTRRTTRLDPQFRSKLQAAGLAPSGALGQRIPLSEAPWLSEVGELTANGTGIRWKPVAQLQGQSRGQPWPRAVRDPRVLDAFVKLADGAPSDVRQFVTRFGMLALCKCGIPAHRDCRPLNPQPVEWYLHYAKEVRAVLSLMVDARDQNARIDLDDWSTVTRASAGIAYDKTPTRLAARFAIWQTASWWLAQSPTDLRLAWSQDGEPTVQLGGGGTWGALARQLAFAVARGHGIALCAGCGATFTPKRIQAGRVSWCDTCKQTGAAARESKRRQRARIRGRR